MRGCGRRRGRQLDGRERRDRVGPGVKGERYEGAPGVVEEARVVTDALDHVADPHDDVEVLPQSEHVEDRTEHALRKHPPPRRDQGQWASAVVGEVLRLLAGGIFRAGAALSMPAYFGLGHGLSAQR